MRVPERIRVVKVGGSLLDWPLLPRALDVWLNKQPSAANVWIAGGGRLVDAIRDASQMSPWDDETAHWLSIDAMSSNSRCLTELMPGAEWFSTFDGLRSAIRRGPCSNRVVFDAAPFLREQEAGLPGHLLPHDWSVTSDSIAARVAEVLAADELVLVKSANPPGGTTAALANAGYVDHNFTAFDRCGFRRRFVNLRQAAKRLIAWEV